MSPVLDLAYPPGGLTQGRQLGERPAAVQQAEPTVRRRDRARRIDVVEGGIQAGSDFVNVLDPALGDGDNPQYGGGPRERLKQRQVVGAMGILDGNRLDRRTVDGLGEIEI